MDRLGQQLGNYRLTCLLGRGGFAEVYLGEHIVLGTMVAVKILHTQVGAEDVARFEQEARLLASLRHPHIIRVLDFGLDGQVPYLMMDYAPNGTLRTRHAKGTQLPVSIVINYVKQIAEALQYAHDRKIVHRDIKPANMLIGENDQLLLSDFGIALIDQSSRALHTREMAGTIAYMAPEQINAHPRSASDQYSLGIVAYEWLCGMRPFDGSYTEIAIKHKLALPPFLRERLPTLSPDVEHVILIALSKRPEERFASVSAFAMALEQASQDMLPTERGQRANISSSFYETPPKQLAEPLISYTTQLPQSVSVPRIEASSDLSAAAKTTHKATVSRRTVLIGVTSIAAIGVVGASAFLIARQQSLQGSGAPLPNRTVTPLTPTAVRPPFVYRGHSDFVMAVAWLPNGERIASSSRDKTVQVWDAVDGGNVFTYQGHLDAVSRVVWSPDGKRIASGSADKTVQVWNASDGNSVFTYRGHSGEVDALAWSPDVTRIVSGSWDSTAQVWYLE